MGLLDDAVHCLELVRLAGAVRQDFQQMSLLEIEMAV